jgi:hypothetical protein
MDMNVVLPGSLGGERKGVMSAAQPAYGVFWGLGVWLCFWASYFRTFYTTVRFVFSLHL